MLALDITIDITSSLDEKSSQDFVTSPDIFLCQFCGHTIMEDNLNEHIQNKHDGWYSQFYKKSKSKIKFVKRANKPTRKKVTKMKTKTFDISSSTYKAIRENPFRSEMKLKRNTSFKKYLPKKNLFSSLKMTKEVVDEFEISQNFIPQRTSSFSFPNQKRVKYKQSKPADAHSLFSAEPKKLENNSEAETLLHSTGSFFSRVKSNFFMRQPYINFKSLQMVAFFTETGRFWTMYLNLKEVA